MADSLLDQSDAVRSALGEIVAEHGPAVLSMPAMMSSLLADLLPEAPRVTGVLVAGASAGLADALRDHVSQGVDAATASRLVASSFAAATLFTAEACSWVVGEFGFALGLMASTADAPAGAARPSAEPVARPEAVGLGETTGPIAPAATDGIPARPVTFPEATSRARLTRRKRAFLAGTAVAVLGVAAGLIAWAWPAQRPVLRAQPVLRPGGLTAVSSASTSVSLSWPGPATGSVPDRYVVAVDGRTAGSVPGTFTSYVARGLAPATSYGFEVRAVRSGRSSAWSPELRARTVTPPISAAVLSSSWVVQQKVIRSAPGEHTFLLGKTWTNDWQFGPLCRSGPCAVTLTGHVYGSAVFTATLKRTGAVYTGETGIGGHFAHCIFSNGYYPLRTVVDFRIRVIKGNANLGSWAASAWTGTMSIHYSYPPNPNICSWSWEASLRGSR